MAKVYGLNREESVHLAMEYAHKHCHPSTGGHPDYKADMEEFLGHYEKYMDAITEWYSEHSRH